MNPRIKPGRKAPFLYIAVCFILGIVLQRILPGLNWRICFILCFVLAIYPLVISIFRRTALLHIRLSSSILAFLLVLTGYGYDNFYQSYLFNNNLPQQGFYTGIINQKTPAANQSQKYIVHIDGYKTEKDYLNANEKILLQCNDSVLNSVLVPGNRILFKGQLREITNRGNPAEFDYKKYMLSQEIRYQAFDDNSMVYSQQGVHSLRIQALLVRSQLLELYRKHGFENDVFGVLAALTLGEKSYLSNEVKSSFASSGAMHVLAVSGLHVGIISILLGNLIGLFRFFQNRYIYKGLLIIVLLWCFAFIAGLSPSVMRATFMFSVIELGRSLRKNSNFFNTLGFSAFLMMLIKPGFIFDVGFQLSYLAVGGIVFFQPKFMKLILVRNKILRWIWSMFTVSLAAQLSTTPISLYYFHQFPTYFWLSNFIVVPGAAFILYGSVIFFLTSFISGVSEVVVFILKYFIWGMNWCVKAIEELPGSVVDELFVGITLVLVLYMLLFFLVQFFLHKKVSFLYASLWVVVLLLSFDIYHTLRNQDQDKLIVYNTYPDYLISYLKGNRHYYLATDGISISQIKLLSEVSGYYSTNSPMPYTEIDTIQKYGKRHVLSVGSSLMIIEESSNKFIRDIAKNSIVIRSNNHRILLYNLTTGEPSSFLKEVDAFTLKDGIQFYDLRKGGALILDLKSEIKDIRK